jgi:hypothetical protein
MSDLELSLIENAYDFLEEAVDRLLEHDESVKRCKYAVLHIAGAIELFLKQCLYNEDWTLIFDKPAKADKALLASGEFKSVSFENALTRVEEECSVDFGQSKTVIDNLRKKRNKVQHYQVDLEEAEVMSILSKAWTFVMDFTDGYLSENHTLASQEIFLRIKQKMTKVEEFVDALNAEIEPLIQDNLERDVLLIECPTCMQPALPLTGEDTQCLFCKHSYDADSLEDVWMDAFPQWKNERPSELAHLLPDQTCPGCDGSGFHKLEISNALPEVDYLCFSCGGHWSEGQLGECGSCGQLYESNPWDEDDTGMCSDCVDAYSDDD